MSMDAIEVPQRERHHVYLAVPGKRICWGTVTGVINCTRQHTAYPFNGGFGFSGQEDFNLHWTDAMNKFEAGEITHFAMLHGDITPDPETPWLDVLLDEMDARGASLVSAASPIKDGRGLTSSGICDLEDPWRPYRRFTVRELLQSLPETFDNVAAGYPDRPLLHNTGLWVCDLRREVFRRENERGELDLYFRFPTRAVRGTDGKWEHQRESEDWAFSRDLWERGVRDTWITSRVKLTHHGTAEFGTHTAWGQFIDGDENTADKWRAAQDQLPLRCLQMLQFELGRACNLAHLHPKCPNLHRDRFRYVHQDMDLDDQTIVEAALKAYNELGFTGKVGFAYYNEPLVEIDRMLRLMTLIKAGAPAARFILWTNGTLIPEDCEPLKQFAEVIVSGYTPGSLAGYQRLLAAGVSARLIQNPQFDDRLEDLPVPDGDPPCLRPFVELCFDCYGNSHLCCYDWRGEGTLGNLLHEPMETIALRWREELPRIAGQRMSDEAPQVCRNCGRRWDKYQVHDEAVVARARRFRESLPTNQEHECCGCKTCSKAA